MNSSSDTSNNNNLITIQDSDYFSAASKGGTLAVLTTQQRASLDKVSTDASKIWQSKLAAAGYQIEDALSMLCAAFWDLDYPLILEGEPGGGKTVLFEKMAEVSKAPLYFLACHSELSRDETHYRYDEGLRKIVTEEARLLNNGRLPDNIGDLHHDRRTMVPGVIYRALTDPSDHVILIIDELDKIPENGRFEAVFLEFLATLSITVTETGQVIKRPVDKPIHVGITSNAVGSEALLRPGDRLSLSHPVLRRCLQMTIPLPTIFRQYKILHQTYPRVSSEMLSDLVLFFDLARQYVQFVKPISLSELKAGAAMMEWCGMTSLNRDNIALLYPAMVKTTQDRVRLDDQISHLFTLITRRRKDFITRLKSMSYW